MKKLILASAVMLAMTGCFESDDFACDVSNSGTSVKVFNKYKDYKYEETSTLKKDEYGYDYIDIVTKTTYPTNASANEACEDEKEEASYWHDGSHRTVCSGKTVTVYDYSDEDDLVDIEYNYERMC